jgi:hypothetical protein
MKTLMLSGLVTLSTATAATAQWAAQPDPRVPTLHGEPNLSAPTPTAPDGRPDLSGVWLTDGGPVPPGGPHGRRRRTAGVAALRESGGRETPDLVLVLYEENSVHRQIFLDGRKTVADPQPRWNGYSTGRWEGDTLVVETTGFNDLSW